MKFSLLISIVFCSNLYAMDVTMKGDYYQTHTDNVNSSNSSITSDTYTDYVATLQFKNPTHKLKFKAKVEKYETTTSNNSNYFNIGYGYKTDSKDDFTLEAFKQKYSVTPSISTDTSSDNTGGKIGYTFNKSFDKDRSGYISLLGTYKNYTKISSRKDSIVDLNMGYENYLTKDFSMTAEMNLEYNKSKDSYYTNFNLGPALYLNYSLTPNFELFANALLTYTSYNSRTFQTTVRNRTVNNKEHQTLSTLEIGALYTFFNHIVLQAKYTSNNNTTNNTTSSSSAYKSHLFMMNVGLRF